MPPLSTSQTKHPLLSALMGRLYTLSSIVNSSHPLNQLKLQILSNEVGQLVEHANKDTNRDAVSSSQHGSWIESRYRILLTQLSRLEREIIRNSVSNHSKSLNVRRVEAQLDNDWEHMNEVDLNRLTFSTKIADKNNNYLAGSQKHQSKGIKVAQITNDCFQFQKFLVKKLICEEISPLQQLSNELGLLDEVVTSLEEQYNDHITVKTANSPEYQQSRQIGNSSRFDNTNQWDSSKLTSDGSLELTIKKLGALKQISSHPSFQMALIQAYQEYQQNKQELETLIQESALRRREMIEVEDQWKQWRKQTGRPPIPLQSRQNKPMQSNASYNHQMSKKVNSHRKPSPKGKRQPKNAYSPSEKSPVHSRHYFYSHKKNKTPLSKPVSATKNRSRNNLTQWSRRNSQADSRPVIQSQKWNPYPY